MDQIAICNLLFQGLGPPPSTPFYSLPLSFPSPSTPLSSPFHSCSPTLLAQGNIFSTILSQINTYLDDDFSSIIFSSCILCFIFLYTIVVWQDQFTMLAISNERKNCFQHSINEGDLVIVYERHDNLKAVRVCTESVLHNRYGVFKHADWIGRPFGSKVLGSKGKFVYLLATTPEL